MSHSIKTLYAWAVQNYPGTVESFEYLATYCQSDGSGEISKAQNQSLKYWIHKLSKILNATELELAFLFILLEAKHVHGEDSLYICIRHYDMIKEY